MNLLITAVIRRWGHMFDSRTGFVLLLEVLEKPWNLSFDFKGTEKPLKKRIWWETAWQLHEFLLGCKLLRFDISKIDLKFNYKKIIKPLHTLITRRKWEEYQGSLFQQRKSWKTLYRACMYESSYKHSSLENALKIPGILYIQNSAWTLPGINTRRFFSLSFFKMHLFI